MQDVSIDRRSRVNSNPLNKAIQPEAGVMQQKQTGIRKALVTPYILPALPYGYGDLAPVIDEETMRLHHDKHHQAYTDGITRRSPSIRSGKEGILTTC
jgi:Fe-Mn family superoxide dismutase